MEKEKKTTTKNNNKTRTNTTKNNTTKKETISKKNITNKVVKNDLTRTQKYNTSEIKEKTKQKKENIVDKIDIEEKKESPIKKKRKIKWKNIIALIILLVLLTTLVYSSINIVKWFIDNKKTDDVIKNINDIVKIEKIKDNDNTEVIKQEDIDEKDPYYDFITMDLINVDFKDLKKQNSDTVGWIQVKGTSINYPFVQASDNDYYLNHSFDKSYNGAGWVFLDYRNNKDDFNQNTIIYAHGRLNKTMFGTLRNILNSSWLEETNNHVIKLSTEYENTLWQVISVYKIPETDDYLQINFDEGELKEFGDMLINRSEYDFNTSITDTDKILTLSTCYDDYTRVVLHAKLIKREKK